MSIFTKIIKREIPAQIVYEDDEFIVFHDAFPKAPVHVLIVPKEEIRTLEALELDDAFQLRLLALARKMARELGIADNYKLLMNVGEDVQMVKHIHLHLRGGWSPEELEKVK